MAIRLFIDGAAGTTGLEIRDRLQGRDEFELIVLSEFGYYLDSRDWAQVIDQAQASLSPQGSLLACHFLRPMAECPQTGQQVHEQLQARLDLVHVMQHREADFLLELWCREPGGVDLEEPCL